MKRYIGRIWMALLVVALGIVVVVEGDSLASAVVGADERPFMTALMQLGILYIVALFVERSLLPQHRRSSRPCSSSRTSSSRPG